MTQDPRPTGPELHAEISAFINRLGILQAHFCQVTGIRDGTISHIRNAVRPKPQTVRRVRDAFAHWPNRAPEREPEPVPAAPIAPPDDSVAAQVARDAQRAVERREVARSFATVSDRVMIDLDRPAAPIAETFEGDRRPPAFSREPCTYCQVRGDLGCRHQQPYRAEAA